MSELLTQRSTESIRQRQDPKHRNRRGKRSNERHAEANCSHFEQWRAAMAAGSFCEAWKINDAQAQHWPSAHQMWSGEPLRGQRIELQALHGLGDFVQMMRFIPCLNQMGCEVTLNVRPELQPMLPFFSGDFQTATAADPDTHRSSIEMMELPYALRMESEDLPAAENYLSLPDELTVGVRRHMNPSDSRPKIGLVWHGSTWDAQRWIPAEQLVCLLELDCCAWWSMQGGAAAAEGRGLRLSRLDSITAGDLLQFAAAIQNLDLLITVDTLAAHIAGALGKPVWLLLKKDADWRWLKDRENSPWYPSMRLIRQTTPGDWHTVLQCVGADLQFAYAGKRAASLRLRELDLRSKSSLARRS